MTWRPIVSMLTDATTPATLDELVLAGRASWPAGIAVLVCIGAFLWAARARTRAVAALGNPALVGRLMGSVHPGRRWLQALAVIVAAAALCGALLRPQYGGTAKVVPASGLDVVLVVDYSKSMLARDVYPSRTERLEAELTRFLEDADRRGDRVGVVVFAGNARGFPVTHDTRMLELYLSRADPRTENPGGTALGKGLRLALAFLVDARSQDADEDASEGASGDSEHEQVVVLLTDGEDTTSAPLEVAEEAGRLGVRVYTVGIGSASGEPIQKFDAQGEPAGFVTDDAGNYLMTRLDETLLRNIAEQTQGEFVAVDPDTFSLDEIRAKLEQLSSGNHEVRTEITRNEGFGFGAIPAMVLLCIALGLPDRRRRRGT